MPEHDASVETDIMADVLALVGFCAVNKKPDDTYREPGRITITTVGCAWAVEVIDMQQEKRFRVVAATLDDALQLADLLIRVPAPPWMQWVEEKYPF